MLVSAFILKLRQFVKDLPVQTRDSFDGDASSTLFRIRRTPIVSDSLTVKIGGVTQATSTFTVDLDTGDLEFTAAPAAGNDNVTIDYKYANLRDTEWMDIITDVLYAWREKIWSDNVDETLRSVAYQDDYDLSTISNNILMVVSTQFKRTADTISDWVDTSAGTNVLYYKEQNILNIRPSFGTAGYSFRVRYLEAFEAPTAVSDTFSVPDKYHTAMVYACSAEYLDRIMSRMVSDMGASVTEATYKTMESVGNLRQRYMLEAERRLSRVRPVFPSTKIKTVHNRQAS